MSQYKQRLAFERQLIKKINGWFNNSKLSGLSIDALNRWISMSEVNKDSIGVLKLINMSDRLKALANRSQELVDPSIPIELSNLKTEIDSLNKNEFRINHYA